jgi:hypothetical protein
VDKGAKGKEILRAREEKGKYQSGKEILTLR